MTVERFQAEHLKQLTLQPMQAAAAPILEDPEYLAAIAQGVAMTIRNTQGDVMACAGSVDYEDGSLLWAFLDASAGRSMVALIRAGRRLAEIARKPVYATAACEFPAGCRLLQMLGFEQLPEPVAGVSADGRAHYVFVRYA